MKDKDTKLLEEAYDEMHQGPMKGIFGIAADHEIIFKRKKENDPRIIYPVWSQMGDEFGNRLDVFTTKVNGKVIRAQTLDELAVDIRDELGIDRDWVVQAL